MGCIHPKSSGDVILKVKQTQTPLEKYQNKSEFTYLTSLHLFETKMFSKGNHTAVSKNFLFIYFFFLSHLSLSYLLTTVFLNLVRLYFITN